MVSVYFAMAGLFVDLEKMYIVKEGVDFLSNTTKCIPMSSHIKCIHMSVVTCVIVHDAYTHKTTRY